MILKIISIISFIVSINFIIGNAKLFLKQKGLSIEEENNNLSRKNKHKKYFSLHYYLFFNKKYKKVNIKFFLSLIYFSCIPWLDLLSKLIDKSILVIFVIIFLVFIGFFMSYKDKTDYLPFRIGQYIMNFLIVSIYILTFLSIFDKIHQNYILLIIIVVLIIYFSTIFIRSVMMNFSNFPFVFLNIVFIVIIDLLSIAMLFGFFYLENNSLFNFFDDKEYDELMSPIGKDKYTYYYFFIVLSKGLVPATSYSVLKMNSNLFDLHGYILIVPFFQYILYFLYSICLLSFIISSGVARTTKSA